MTATRTHISRSRRPWAILLFLAGAIALAVLLGRSGVETTSSSEHTGDGATRPAGEAGARNESPSLAGAPTSVADVPPTDIGEPTWRLGGTLTMQDGTPCENGGIYLLPKEKRGVTAWSLVSRFTSVGDGGRWELARRSPDAPPPSPAGHWVVGTKKGAYPVFFDGDLWDGHPIHLVSRPGRRLEIRAATPEGVVPPAAWAQAWTDGELVEEAYACPGPDASYRVNVHGRLSSAGALTLSVGTDDPVRVRVRCLGYYAEPESQVAARDSSPLRFTLHPACSIHITPLDDRTGDPVEPKTFRIVREGHGLLEKGAFPERGMPGRYARGGLRPGTYVVEIVTPPYVDWRSPPIVLTEPAESKHVVANLVVNRDLGTLALSVPQPEAQPTAQESVHVAIRHAEGDGTWQMHGWYRWPPGNAPTGTPAMLGGEIAHLPSGRYDVILWVGRKRLVGKAQSVVVKPGETTEVAIYVAPGLSIRASKQAEEDRSLRTVIVRSPDLGRLPYMFLLRGGTRIEVDEHLRNATELGPYPVDELSIVEKRPGEDPVVRTVRR